MADTAYEITALRARRDDTQGMYLIEAEIGGLFVAFSAIKTGHLDELLEREHDRQVERDREQAAQEQERERQEREREWQEREQREREQQQRQQ